MATLSRVARLRLDDALTHGTNVLQWTATASVEQTPAGGSVEVTIVRITAGAPPADPTTLDLKVYKDDGTLIKTESLDVAAANQLKTFHFTDTGNSGSSTRAGTVEIAIRAIRNQGVPATDYDVETDGAPNDPPDLFDTHLDRGFIIGTTTRTTTISNVSAGGAKNLPASYTTPVSNDGGDSLFVRSNLGASLYTAKALTHAVSGATPSLSGVSNSSAAGPWDTTFSKVCDNRFPAGVTSAATSATTPAGSLNGGAATGVATVVFSSVTEDSINVDPRFTVGAQSEKDNTRTEGANETQFVISADSLFVWARLFNARGEIVSGVTLTQRLLNGVTVVVSNTTQVTQAADGWTPNPGIDWTSFVAAPAGNRTQDAFPNAPSDATGLGTGQQHIGFASAYTADKFFIVRVADEVPLGESQTIVVEYRKTDGTIVRLDSVPSLRIYSVNDTTGAETDELALGVMTEIGTTGVYKRTWTPSVKGVFLIEVRGTFAAGGVEGGETVTVRDRYDALVLDVGLANRM